jgi:hypothetical protein
VAAPREEWIEIPVPSLVETTDQVEQQLSAGLGERQIAEFIENDEVETREIIREASLASSARLRLKPVDEIDGGEEAAARSGADAASRDGDRQMRLARAGSTDEDDIAPTGDEVPPARSRTRTSLMGVPANTKSSTSLANGNLAMASWYLIERACFSDISAFSRSPTNLCGSCLRLSAVARVSS